MRYYHRTAAADAILTEGFRDGQGTYVTGEMQTGVFLSDFALDVNEGAGRSKEWAVHDGQLPLLAVEIEPELFAEYEWLDEDTAYREWYVPAEILNRHAFVRMLSQEEVEESEWGWHCQLVRILRDRGKISEEEYEIQTIQSD
jgi:hypothetical protein